MEPGDLRWHEQISWPASLDGFHFLGQPFAHQAFLIVGLLLLATSVAAVVLSVFDRQRRLRPVWCVGSLLGFGKVIVNWTAGGWDVFPISIQIPLLSIFRGVSQSWGAKPSDWFVGVGVPFIAFAYFIVRVTSEEVPPSPKVKEAGVSR